VVTGEATLISGSPSTKAVALSGSAQFTSAATYFCTIGNATHTGGTVLVHNDSGSQFTLTGDVSSTDSYFFICIGN
jgi:hypothetical protein